MKKSFTDKHNIRKSFGKIPDLVNMPNLLEIQKNSALSSKRVAIVDDIFATGGTLSAATTLIRKQESIVVCSANILWSNCSADISREKIRV